MHFRQDVWNYLYANRSLWKAADAMRDWHETLFLHAVNTAGLAVSMAQILGFSETETEAALLGSFLHDYGKVSWPQGLKNKCPLDPDDWEFVTTHPLLGTQLVRDNIRDLPPLAIRIIAEHHEKDGKGYPRKLQNSEIHPLSRVVSCAECYAAMTEDRPYRPHPLKPQDAIRIMSQDGFDETFLEALSRAATSSQANHLWHRGALIVGF